MSLYTQSPVVLNAFIPFKETRGFRSLTQASSVILLTSNKKYKLTAPLVTPSHSARKQHRPRHDNPQIQQIHNHF